MGTSRPEGPQNEVEPAGRSGPTSEFWRYLWFPAVFSVAALLLRQDLVFLLGTLVVGCGAAAYPLCRWNVAGVRVTQVVPTRTVRGERTDVVYRVENRGERAAIGIEVQDELHRTCKKSTYGAGWHESRVAEVRFEVPCLDAGSSTVVRTDVEFVRRGPVVMKPPVVSSRFPLGIFRTVLPAQDASEILVHPSGSPTNALLARLRGQSGLPVDGLSHARGWDTLYGLREHREGDDPRRIHWRSSARRGQLVVADWRADAGLEVVVVLGSCGARGPSREFEIAVSITTAIWRALHRLRLRGQLVLGKSRSVAAGARAFAAGLDELARVSDSKSRQPERALKRLSLMPGARFVVFVTPRNDPGDLARAQAAAGKSGRAWILRADANDAATWVWLHTLP